MRYSCTNRMEIVFMIQFKFKFTQNIWRLYLPKKKFKLCYNWLFQNFSLIVFVYETLLENVNIDLKSSKFVFFPFLISKQYASVSK